MTRAEHITILQDIECGETWGDLLFASTSEALFNRLERSELLRHARAAYKTNPIFRSLCRLKAQSILLRRYPEGVAHPNRTSLSAFLYLFAGYPDELETQLIASVVEEPREDLPLVKELARMLYSKELVPCI